MDVLKGFGGLVLLVAGLVGVLVNSFIVYGNLRALSEATGSVRHTLITERLMSDLLTTLLSAENGQRGYLISGGQRNLAQFYEASGALPQKLAALRQEVSDNPLQVSRIAQLQATIKSKLEDMSATIQSGIVGAGDSLAAGEHGRAPVSIAASQAILQEMAAEEAQLLAEREKIYDARWRISVVSMLAFAVTSGVLILALFILVRRENRHRLKSAAVHGRQVVEIERTLRTLELERNQIARINEISSFLQSCTSLQEIGSLLSAFLERLFPTQSGALYLYAASRNQLVRHAQWGGGGSAEVVQTEQCWALRRGQIHRSGAATPVCTHHEEHVSGREGLCLPLVAYGETIGLLSFSAKPDHGQAGEGDTFDSSTSHFAEMVARQISLAVANLQLRDTLKDQAIRDPLTGTFNRRYLQLVGEKEIAQSLRLKQPLAVVMLDVDHFKQFNDVHGHAAGDLVLVSVCDYIRRQIRESDWMFRYGGEEFVLLIGEASLAEIEARVGALCRGVAELTIAKANAVLPSVTISIGVAVISEIETTLQAALRQADQALYASKAAGRNRVTFSGRVSA